MGIIGLTNLLAFRLYMVSIEKEINTNLKELRRKKKTAMNEGLIITLLIVNIALSGAALLGVFVMLGIVRGGQE